ncbi:ATP-binding protein [Planosporangium thailandense]|uniref:ATP-binding protein n=1 Tax=Planosporangium thailandense TaxID=765197 RepID=A0ABX0Y9D5_9ACTN|nr:ATP-binding protein [Planosporangium thailandense]NJC74003.1 ATP-binding protein [Planosporangium thailandense]
MPDDPGASAPPPTLLSALFDADHITAVRHAVSGRAHRAGLAGRRLDDFILAVNEVMTNVARHAGGSGVLTLWRQDRTLRCEVTDSGPGMPPEHLHEQPLPSPFAVNGRGLWLARRLCDRVTIETGPQGTTVGLAIALAPEPHPAEPR